MEWHLDGDATRRGTAALLKSFDFDLTVAGLKAALLGGVDPRPALTTKTVTGGRLNARKSLDLVNPPPGLGVAPAYFRR